MKRLISVLLFLAVSFAATAQHLSVASYNIRNNGSNDDAERGNGWQQRCPVVCQLIRYNDFDIFGTQEVLNDQLNDMLTAMPEYGYVGVGRDDGKTAGEYSPIMYKKDKFNVLKSGHFWLSEKTDYPNKGWDAVLPRICTWVRLEHKTDKYKVWFFNLHMDHVGVKAREESSKLVLRKIAEMCGNDAVILTGDFNVDQNHDNYKVLAQSKVLKDSYEVAEFKYALNGTFNAFDPNTTTTSRIDHIFVSAPIKVKKYAVLTDTYRSEISEKEFKSGNFPKEVGLHTSVARVPSDHFPVRVDIELSAK